MKKLIYLLFVMIGCLTTSCHDFLLTENYTEKNTGNFPKTEEDMVTALNSAYTQLAPIGGLTSNVFLVTETLSDLRFGGGGVGDTRGHAINQFKQVDPNMLLNIWANYYNGINRSNFVIESIDKINWADQAKKNKVLGEAHFLRGYFYMELARLFGPVPIQLSSTTPENKAKGTPDEVWGLIGSDYKKAIELLPGAAYSTIKSQELGRATKWAAEGMMARAFLFYTGYYKKNEIPLPEGGSITKANVIAWVDDCVTNSGHNLVADYRNLWPYAVVPDYKYTKDNNLKWVGDGLGNIEAVFSIKFSKYGDWGGQKPLANQLMISCGLRGQAPIPFASGWGAATVNPQLYQEWPDTDIRKKASIADVQDPNEGINYQFGLWNQMHETGYLAKKMMPMNMLNSQGNPVSLSTALYGGTENYMIQNSEDLKILRFADILLMGAELGGNNAQSYLDRVRTRAGLTPVPSTLENIKSERKYELAFEFSRFYDLMRWGDVEKEFAKVKNIPVLDNAVKSTITLYYRAETGGFYQIPESEIALSNGKLIQNPGWDSNSSLYDPNKDK
jgi:starch-binding outer membrane protein, SusD/RagB family